VDGRCQHAAVSYSDAVTDGAAEFNEHVSAYPNPLGLDLSGSCDDFDPIPLAGRTRYIDSLTDVRSMADFRFWRTRTPVARFFRHNGQTVKDFARLLAATLVTVTLLAVLIIIPSALVITSLTTPLAQYAGLVLAIVATSAACIPAVKLMGRLA
jgi:hypothetical protein